MFFPVLGELEGLDRLPLLVVGSLLLTIVCVLPASIIMLIAAKKLMACAPRWPAYVIGGAAVYSPLVPILLNPIVRNISLGLPYSKIIGVLNVVSWLVGIASSIAILTVCKRFADLHINSNDTNA